MPIKIPDDLPARQILTNENIYLITRERAEHQDIRPLRIIILNLMPKKQETETQLLRLLGNTPLQIEVELLQTATHKSKNTDAEHLFKFYESFEEIEDQYYDGLIITGAPVEHMEFEEVDYWPELKSIMAWSSTHVFSTYHICWGSQVGLYYHYGIPKVHLDQKMFGIFPHKILDPTNPLLRGFDEVFMVPHSRHTASDEEAIRSHPELNVLTYSDISGIHLIANHDFRRIFVSGHSEYDRMTLANEYWRDKNKNLPIEIPYNYFPNNDPNQRPPFVWRSHANLLIKNWLNLVYQLTPYDLRELESMSIR